MATTYVAIESQTLSSAASTVTFTGIPSTYTDLVVSINIAGLSVQETPKMYFNGDTSALYSTTFLDANGTSTISNRLTGQGSFYGIGALNSGNPTGVSSILVNINNYANTTTFKTMMSRNAGGALSTGMTVGLYRSTSAITSISFIVHGGHTYSTGSTFSLYGIASAAVGTPKATGGNIITTDGNYWYHAFTASGTFTPTQALTSDVLVVAGGGGAGGGSSYSGGGAGGLLAYSSQSLTTTGYTVTVGAGGAGTNNGSVAATSGSNSQFASLTASVGGGGGGGGWTGSANGAAALTGGSGGGGGGAYSAGGATTTNLGAAGTAGQGFAGGNGSPLTGTASQLAGGGGGGAGAVGANGSSGGAGGAGGAGVNTYSSWLSPTGLGVNGYIAGGGAGWGQTADAVAGLGNGGNSNGSVPIAPRANTGGGGSGAASVSGTAGASGLVIVRYAV